LTIAKLAKKSNTVDTVIKPGNGWLMSKTLGYRCRI